MVLARLCDRSLVSVICRVDSCTFTRMVVGQSRRLHLLLHRPLFTGPGGFRRCNRTESGHAGNLSRKLAFSADHRLPYVWFQRTAVEFSQRILVLRVVPHITGRRTRLESAGDTHCDLTCDSLTLLSDLFGIGDISGIPHLVGRSFFSVDLFQLRVFRERAVRSVLSRLVLFALSLSGSCTNREFSLARERPCVRNCIRSVSFRCSSNELFN